MKLSSWGSSRWTSFLCRRRWKFIPDQTLDSGRCTLKNFLPESEARAIQGYSGKLKAAWAHRHARYRRALHFPCGWIYALQPSRREGTQHQKQCSGRGERPGLQEPHETLNPSRISRAFYRRSSQGVTIVASYNFLIFKPSS